ncbi:MAG: hypothetical protein ACJ761_10690 [Chloroflexota bacterium]
MPTPEEPGSPRMPDQDGRPRRPVRRRRRFLRPARTALTRAASAATAAGAAATSAAGAAAAPVVGAAAPIVDAARPIVGAARPIVGAASPVVGAAKDAARDVVAGMGQRLAEAPGARARRIRRLAAEPLASLPELHPEARNARPVEIGLRSIDVDQIVGTAVGGGDQRGGDFLPLKPFRGRNWNARWQRLKKANDRLVALPPIDVVKYADGYWVVDGHNRVGLARYSGQQEIDASVVELVPPGGQRTEPLGPLATTAVLGRQVRAAGEGHVPSTSDPMQELPVDGGADEPSREAVE